MCFRKLTVSAGSNRPAHSEPGAPAVLLGSNPFYYYRTQRSHERIADERDRMNRIATVDNPSVAERDDDGRAEAKGELSLLAVNKSCWGNGGGGAEANLRETLSRLVDRGHDVTLLCGRFPGCADVESLDGIRVERVGFEREFGPPFDVILRYLAVTVAVYRRLARIDPDVVYVVDTPLPWPIYTRRPRVAIFHHVAIDSFLETHPFPQNVLGSIAQRLGARRERRTPTVSVSPSTTNALLDAGHPPATIREIRNGIDVERYTPRESGESGRPDGSASEPRLLYLGGLNEIKGADRLPAIHRTVERALGRSVRLDIAGRECETATTLEAYCAGRDSACFHGYISEERKVELLRRAWVFLAPSRIEGWGLAVLEANACGTPAVGADVEGLRDSIRDGETGVLADAADPDAFAASVVSVLEDDEYRTELSANAREWAQAHSWEEATADLESLFYRVVGSRS